MFRIKIILPLVILQQMNLTRKTMVRFDNDPSTMRWKMKNIHFQSQIKQLIL